MLPLPPATLFADMPDPRRETQNKRDALAIGTCGGNAAAESWEHIARYRTANESFLRRFVPLASGIPSPDTFERVCDKVDPES